MYTNAKFTIVFNCGCEIEVFIKFAEEYEIFDSKMYHYTPCDEHAALEVDLDLDEEDLKYIVEAALDYLNIDINDAIEEDIVEIDDFDITEFIDYMKGG